MVLDGGSSWLLFLPVSYLVAFFQNPGHYLILAVGENSNMFYDTKGAILEIVISESIIVVDDQ